MVWHLVSAPPVSAGALKSGGSWIVRRGNPVFGKHEKRTMKFETRDVLILTGDSRLFGLRIVHGKITHLTGTQETATKHETPLQPSQNMQKLTKNTTASHGKKRGKPLLASGNCSYTKKKEERKPLLTWTNRPARKLALPEDFPNLLGMGAGPVPSDRGEFSSLSSARPAASAHEARREDEMLCVCCLAVMVVSRTSVWW